MSQKSKKYLVVFLLCGSLIFIVLYNYKESSHRQIYEQYTKAQEQETKEHLKQIEEETKIDLSSPKLTPSYEGVDISNLYSYKLSKYSGDPIRKSEYETTEEYNKRIKKTITEIESEMGKDKLFAFKIGGIEKAYDIETKSIKLYLNPEKIYSEYEKKYSTIKPKIDFNSYSLSIKTLFSDTDQYVGQNAFGAKKIVNRYSSKKYYIALFNEDQIMQSGELGFNISYNRPILIEMNPETAKSIKNSIEVLAITKIKVDEASACVALEKDSSSKPTFDNPREKEGKEIYIFTELIGLWIYNMDTGEIYNKIMISE